jgi:MFS family permease
VGIIIPCMPLLVSQLSIPASEFGLVISAFGLSKLIGNIPSGYFVEKYGRKPSISDFCDFLYYHATVRRTHDGCGCGITTD